MTPLRVLDLFSGIGGFSLGLERTGGFETVAFCEIEEYPRRVLAKHWSGVPCYHDVRELTAERLAADGIAVDVICGGFPCQDISTAGKGAGLAGERSGLWREYARIIGEFRPGFVIVENVAALLGRGLGDVLGDLAALGYDAEWHCIPASAVGAPHKRDRVWIIAHSRSEQYEGACLTNRWAPAEGFSEATMADTPRQSGDGGDHHAGIRVEQQAASQSGNNGWTASMADALRIDEQRQQPGVADAERWPRPLIRSLGPCRDGAEWWAVEPGMGRVANGVSDRVDRLKCLGNAVVPQIVEWIGRKIIEQD